jgi:hypothetical protein
METAIRVRPAVMDLVTAIATDMNGKYQTTSLGELASEKSIEFWREDHHWTSTKGLEGRMAREAEELQVTVPEFKLMLHLDLIAEMRAAIEEIVLSGSTIAFTPLVSELMGGR